MTKHKSKDGKPVWVEVNSKIIFDENGNYDGVVGVIRDISDRLKAEEKLRKSENRYKAYFDKGLIGMVVTSVDKRFIEANDKFCDMLGYSRVELSEISWADLTYHEDLEPDLARFKRILSGEINTYCLEKRFIHKDGRIIYTTISVNAIRKNDGSVDYIIGMTEDLTKRKRAEEELAKYRDRLEELVKERIKELEDKNKELDNAIKVFVGRELTIKKLQERIRLLGGH